MKSKLTNSIFRLTAICCLLALCSGEFFAQQKAGITVADAPMVADVASLLVCDGSNFVKLDSRNLPAVVTYIPDSAFGPLPALIVDGEDTIQPTCIFVGCQMQWQWDVTQNGEMRIVDVVSHENASILVEPHICPADIETTAEVWDSIAWGGQTRTQNGDYTLDLVDPSGCEYMHTLHLTVHHTLYDTVPMSGCDSLEYQGKNYKQSGVYVTDTAALQSGDRQINCIRLLLHRSSQYEQTVNQYDPFVSATGKQYTSTGVYTDTIPNTVGCDSVITTRLKIYATTYDTVPQNVCDSLVEGSKKYTLSGLYNDTTVLSSGDRTIRTLDLTVRRSSYSLLTISQYEPYVSDQHNTYSESGEYVEKITNAAGCDSIITLRITIMTLNISYDTVYFCRGFNTVHEERITDEHVRRYLPYLYESPATWDYMEGTIISGNHEQTLVDLKRAEANLRNHYTKALTPVEHIAWSVRGDGNGVYTPITVQDQPQWLPAGRLAVQIQFRCGELYNTEFPMALDETNAAQQAVKRIENGQVVILRGGEKYTILGTKLQ